MEKMIFFESDCSGQYYDDFLDYAFSSNDYFMLVYVNYKQRGYTQTQSYFKKALSPYKVKTRTNPSWPGTLRTIRPNATYQIVFYRTDDEAKKLLKEMRSLWDWSSPQNAEDLAFFKGDQCWFYSVGHEKIAAIIHANKNDRIFITSLGLTVRNIDYDPYYDAYNESIE